MIIKRPPIQRGDYWSIPLSQQSYALVDDADIDLVRHFNWSAQSSRPGRLYAVTRIAGRLVYMHQLIGFRDGDHINGDGLDNRRTNLRHASRSQNAANQRKRKGALSQYKGVSPRGNRFLVLCGPAGSKRYVGMFGDEEEAARAYDTAALRHFGEFARLNFPPRRRIIRA